MLIVAETIRKQLGGNRFAAMTGAKNFVGSADSLQFDIGRGARNKATKVRVKLEADDTYTMTFYRWNAKALEMTIVAEDFQIYWDELQGVFTRETGFETRL